MSKNIPDAAGDTPPPVTNPKFYLPSAFVAECYDAGEWRSLSEYTEPPVLADTSDGLLAYIRRLRARLAEAVRKSLALGCDGVGGISARFPPTLVNKAVFLRSKDGNEYAYFLPAIEPLWTAAAAAGVRGLPAWGGEAQSDIEAIQMLDALAERLQPLVPSVDVAGAKQMNRRERRAYWMAQAMLMIRDYPDLTDKAVAEAIGINPSQLTPRRCPEYHAAKKLAIKAREEHLKGHVEIDRDTGRRTLEAYSADDPAEMDWDDDRN